jgi:hypothetical protein
LTKIDKNLILEKEFIAFGLDRREGIPIRD